MATQVQFRGGSTAEHGNFNGAAKEVTVDTSKDVLVVHPGTGAGNGVPMFRASGGDQDISTTGSGQFGTEIRMLRGNGDGSSQNERVNIGGSASNAIHDQAGNFVIKYNGEAEFKGMVDVDTGDSHAGRFINDSGSAWDTLHIRNTNTSVATTSRLINCQTPGGSDAFYVTLAGAASFAGKTQVGTGNLSDVALAAYNDTTTASEPTLYIQNDQSGGNLLQGFGGGSEKVLITGTGAAKFASGNCDIDTNGTLMTKGSVQLDSGGNFGSPKIELIGSSGDATFTGNTVIGDTSSTYVQLRPQGDLTILDSSGSTTQCFGISRVGDSDYSVAFTANGDAVVHGYLRAKDATAQTSTYFQTDGTDGITIVNANHTKATIDMDGNAQFDGSVKIGGDQAANEIDEYEEGTWTPAISASAGSAGTVTAIACRYTKIGRLVHVRGSLLNIDTTNMTSDATLYITGLPFTLQPNTTNGQLVFPVGTDAITTTKGAVAQLTNNGSTITLYEVDDSIGTAMKVSAYTSGDADVYLAITYETT